MNYREFKTLTDKEVMFIALDILNMNEPLEIQRDNNEILVIGKIEDGIESIWMNGLEVNSGDFLVTEDYVLEYKKYLMSLGINHLLKDNKYMDYKVEL